MTTALSMARTTLAFVTISLLAACAARQTDQLRPALPPTSSVAQADQRLAAVAAERRAIEARFAEREALCYEKFLMNQCLDDAKERRRSALASERAIEIEAEYFKRKSKVEERERAMAAADQAFEAEEARAAQAPPLAPHSATALPPPRPSTVTARIARRNAKVEQEAAAANAAERAAKVLAFDARRSKAAERQQAVAERKAQSAAKRAAAQAKLQAEAEAAAEAARKAAAAQR